MRQAAAAMRQEQTAIAQSKGNDALSDLRELEERLTSPTQNPLAQLYRQERNLLAQLLEQTERLRLDQANLRQQTETSASQQVGKSANEGQQTEQPSIRTPATSVKPLSPPTPPSWGEVERLTPERPLSSLNPQRHPPTLPERQRQLRQRAESLRAPLHEAMERIPQLPPETPHRLQDAIEQMSQAEQALRQNERQRASQSQRRAEEALQQLSAVLRQALQSEQGSLSQRMGAGENEAMALARRQAQLLRRTQQLHAQRQQGQRPNPSELQAMGAEEGGIRQALSRMEGFFGEALPPEFRQRMGQAPRVAAMAGAKPSSRRDGAGNAGTTATRLRNPPAVGTSPQWATRQSARATATTANGRSNACHARHQLGSLHRARTAHATSARSLARDKRRRRFCGTGETCPLTCPATFVHSPPFRPTRLPRRRAKVSAKEVTHDR